VAKGTPKPIVDKLEAALRKAIVDPGVSAGLKRMAINPGGGSAAEFRAMIDKDIEGYVSIVKKAHLKFN
jgi:tripartite-type tricarboxylate transporter receptor subunit TctC